MCAAYRGHVRRGSTSRHTEVVRPGSVSFVGAGPGAADLITLRGAQRIAAADVVIWAASLVAEECVTGHARPDAELVDSSRLTHDDVLAIYRRAAADGLRVARVHSGDPALWGAVQEQYDACVELGLEVEIVPGVSAFTAAAAAAGRELTIPEVAQSVVLTRLEGGKTPMPERERLREFARHGTTMAVFLSAARTSALVAELRAGGYPDETPVVVAYRVSWPDELVFGCRLDRVTDLVRERKLWRHTLFLIGPALAASGTLSHLYHAGHFHTFRKPDPAARAQLRGRRAAGR
jgi:precorrin-4/cobalt-precorrin-4 C11-methyltransferase